MVSFWRFNISGFVCRKIEFGIQENLEDYLDVYISVRESQTYTANG